jgi:TatD DNase family protein
MLIDTHCHINMMVKKEFDTPLSSQDLINADNIVQEAIAAGVTRMVTIGTSIIESKNCMQLADRFESVYASIGIHPGDTKSDWQQELAELTKYISHPKVVAIGECGLDYHWPDYNAQLQKDAFRAQIELALEYNKALIVHTRDAYEDTMTILQEYKDSLTRVVMHCYSENLAAARDVTSMGFLIGISGTITYPKNTELRSVVSTLGLTHIVLETDAPFLPPQIARGKQNHPRHVATVAHYLAQHLEIPYGDIALATTENALNLFRIS